MSDKPLKGFVHKTAQGRDSYEIYEADSDLIFKFAEVLEARFGFHPVRNPLDGIDVVYWDFARDEIKLVVGWDVWSGCFVFAETEAGDEIVKEFGQYFDQILDGREAL